MVTVTRYVWDPVLDCVTHELDENNAVKAVYHNEPQQYGGVLSQRRGTTSHYHHHDALGSTRFLTDSSGNVTDTYLHDAWGNLVASTGTTVNPFRWVGKYGYYTDNSTGQVYVRARTYEPSTAGWTAVDPVPFSKTLELYMYALNAPLSKLDPSGELWMNSGGADPTFNETVTEDRRQQCSRMFLTAKEFFKDSELETQTKLIECAKHVKLLDKLKCFMKVFGGDLSDAAKEQLMRFACCVINKSNYPDPCHWGRLVPSGVNRDPIAEYPEWPEEERNYCYPGGKWPFKIGEKACLDCCDYQACIEGFRDIADLKRILKKLQPGGKRFFWHECTTSCSQGEL
jgi:RHS repeat-associated protein